MLKLNHALPQTIDRKTAYDLAVESELRALAVLFGTYGIVSADGADVDDDNAPCALVVDTSSGTASIRAGVVVFRSGDVVEVGANDIATIAIDTSDVDAQVFRLEYGETEAGTVEANPFYNFAAKPMTRKKTALEMLVVESASAYNAQPADVKARSVVIGVLRLEDGDTVADNGRDTYSFSRPWFSPVDTQHRSYVGTGLTTVTNPHGTSINDLTVGNYTAWQALVGGPACVLARANGTGRFPGEICTETVPAGSFATDVTGLITGVAGALYASLGYWPDRLLRCSLDSNNATQVAAWIPRGRNVIAIFDPRNFVSAQTVDVVFTKVTAGALPGALAGLQTIEVGQPGPEELIVAGGNFFSELTENKVLFTDVGLIPMKFDILVDNTGRAYKSPDVVYCNTKLETLGATAQAFEIQPRAPSRLRVALSNFNQGYTEVRLLITGTDENGAALSETVIFTGPSVGPVQTSFTEVTWQRVFTAGVYAQIGQIQVTVRNGDGPNTTVTVFAEQIPERPTTQDDLLLATVQWTGSEVTALYSNDAEVAIDRRLVTTGGGHSGVSTIHGMLNNPMLVDSALGYLPSGTLRWVTLAEDFSDPTYMEYPNDYVGVQTSQLPVELLGNSQGARRGYISRLIPFGMSMNTSTDAFEALWLRMIPRGMRNFPSRHSNHFQILTYMHHTTGTVTFTGTLGTNPYPPYQVNLSAAFPTGFTYYGVRFAILSSTATLRDLSEAFQGFVFHVRQ